MYAGGEVDEMRTWLRLAEKKGGGLVTKKVETVSVVWGDLVYAASVEVGRIGDENRGLIVSVRMIGELPNPGLGRTERDVAALDGIERYSAIVSAVCEEKKAQAKLVDYCHAV